jgi:uncharacterized membrane protein YkvA (DUF1232 family)
MVTSGLVDRAEIDKVNELHSRLRPYVGPLMGMLYIISPLDIIPDFVPLIGLLDDGLVLLYVLFMVMRIWSRVKPPLQAAAGTSGRR